MFNDISVVTSIFETLKKLIIFSGAGISAESGIQTFRDTGGLWENYRIEEVATPQAFRKNPELVLEFYNLRRRNIKNVEPNEAHLKLVELEKYFDVTIITQNIDNLHERAGSKKVLHLHGEITKARGSIGLDKPIEIVYKDIKMGDLANNGSQLRPHIVWFGEDVPEYLNAQLLIQNCDVLVVIGTSLNVYPAAGLIHYAPKNAFKIIIDPSLNSTDNLNEFKTINKVATEGISDLVQLLVMD